MKDAEIDSLKSVIIHYDKYILNLKGQQAMLKGQQAMLQKRDSALSVQRSRTDTSPSTTITGNDPITSQKEAQTSPSKPEK